MQRDVTERVAACERANRKLARLLSIQTMALLLVLGAWVTSCAGAVTGSGTAEPAPLRVSELIVVDSSGVERVRIGGNLPDAVIGGRRVPRGESAAGVLLYDGTGQERSGYVTFEPSGNVGLTLDTRREQVALFVAGPETGSALMLWHGRDMVELRSDDDGSRLSAVKGGQLIFQEPSIVGMTPNTCSAYNDARSRVSAEQVMRDCRRRFGDSACRACLGQP